MYLLILFARTLRFVIRTEDAPVQLVHDGITFREIPVNEEHGLFLGFYDWLRTSSGRVVGVDLTFHDGREPVQRVLSNAGAGTWLSPDILRVVFDKGADIDENASVDQEFSASRCYLGPASQVALLFDATELSEEDRRALSGTA